jgi:hypothetical protein
MPASPTRSCRRGLRTWAAQCLQARLPTSVETEKWGKVIRAANIKARLVARQELAHGWKVRQRLRARRAGYCEHAQPTSPDIPYR